MILSFDKRSSLLLFYFSGDVRQDAEGGSDLQVDHSVHRQREDEGARVAGQKSAQRSLRPR
jgi:hypothetical protein